MKSSNGFKKVMALIVTPYPKIYNNKICIIVHAEPICGHIMKDNSNKKSQIVMKICKYIKDIQIFDDCYKKNWYCTYHVNNILDHFTPYPKEKTLTDNTMLGYIYVYNFFTFKEKQLKFAEAAENNYIHRITTKHAPSIGNTNMREI